MTEENIVDVPLERDVNDHSNDEKTYACEGCGTTFPTGIPTATRCRNCTSSIAWKAEQGEPTSREREDVEREEDTVF
jgi:DNA-directed RNA polymerase subunit RPC12/RpoP